MHWLPRRALLCGLAAAALFALSGEAVHAQADALPSCNDGAVKKSITDFVTRTTTQGGPDFVPLAERIATFDNDGTLWAEQPAHFQVAKALDQANASGWSVADMKRDWKKCVCVRTVKIGFDHDAATI